jgi:hypothetical protein
MLSKPKTGKPWVIRLLGLLGVIAVTVLVSFYAAGHDNVESIVEKVEANDTALDDPLCQTELLTIDNVVTYNRYVLRHESPIPWIRDKEWANSVFIYGLPDHALPKIGVDPGMKDYVALFFSELDYRWCSQAIEST